MDNKKNKEIDLFETLQIILRSKLQIFIIVIISISIGFCFTKIKRESFIIKVPISFNLYPTINYAYCNYDLECTKRQNAERIIYYTSNNWYSKKEKALFIETKSADYISYVTELDKANLLLTAEVLKEEKRQQNLINDILSKDYSNNQLLKNMLNIKRNILLIDSGAKVFNFDKATVKQISPRSWTVILFSSSIGFVFSILFVVARNAYSTQAKLRTKLRTKLGNVK